ncbi:EAL domain-containing protein [Paenibacillus daejeonensis]|uniref:EAL domain-containing protein n=1 Tax=Paenibacillus daejeonensis TaxID=135193 RepID=UPI0003A629D3|nr:EAL domain-containing protein [Paenibacillus daejeonensis]
MMHRQATTSRSANDGRAPSHYGIVYLSWHGTDSAASKPEPSFIAGWQSYIERRLHEDPLGAEVKDRRWVVDDLYLSIPIKGTVEPEEWFQEIRGLQLTLEAGYLAEVPTAITANWTLHAGISPPYDMETLGDNEHWYRAAKQAVIEGQARDSVERSMRRRALQRILHDGLLYPVYQPIYKMGGDIFGFEALSRCEDDRWFAGPLALFSFAEREGAVYSLDRLAREKAISGSSGLGAHQKMFINISANIMHDPHFTPGQTLSLLHQQGLTPRQIVFEVTERSSIEDFETAKKVLSHYRSQGYQIAIDDAGAGYSSLQSIVELQPDYIKVDRSLISQIHRDEIKEHILETFLTFARKMGIQVIAEGIELPEELSKLQAMGVDYGQGYLLGRPARGIIGG